MSCNSQVKEVSPNDEQAVVAAEWLARHAAQVNEAAAAVPVVSHWQAEIIEGQLEDEHKKNGGGGIVCQM